MNLIDTFPSYLKTFNYEGKHANKASVSDSAWQAHHL